MPDILTADFMSESTEELIKKSQQILGGIESMQPRPIIERIMTHVPDTTIFSPLSASNQIRTLAPACNRIEVKNVITLTDASIVICTGSGTGTCPGAPPTCPTGVTPNDYVNMVVTATALVAQTGVKIAFDYLLNDAPTTTEVTVSLAAGSNTIYAFPTNVQYSSDTTLSLFGARVTKY